MGSPQEAVLMRVNPKYRLSVEVILFWLKTIYGLSTRGDFDQSKAEL